MVLHLCRHLLKAIRHPKEEGSINFIHLHPIGDGECLFVEGYVCHWIGIRVNLFGENRQLRHLCHAAHEEQAGKHQTEFDGNGEIEHHSEHEGDEEHHHITFGAVGELGKGAPLAHVVTHHHQHTGKCGHGDISCQRHSHNEDDEQDQCVHHPSNTRASTVVDVGHGARNSSRSRDSAKERRHDVGNALSNEFLVGIVVIARHTVCHRGRKQALNSAQDGNDKSRGEQSTQCVESEVSLCVSEERFPIQVKGIDVRQGSCDVAKSVANGGNVGESALIGEIHRCCGDNDGNERTRESFHPSRTSHDDGDAHRTHRNGIPLQGGDIAKIAYPFVDKRCWCSSFEGES